MCRIAILTCKCVSDESWLWANSFLWRKDCNLRVTSLIYFSAMSRILKSVLFPITKRKNKFLSQNKNSNSNFPTQIVYTAASYIHTYLQPTMYDWSGINLHLFIELKVNILCYSLTLRWITVLVFIKPVKSRTKSRTFDWETLAGWCRAREKH